MKTTKRSTLVSIVTFAALAASPGSAQPAAEPPPRFEAAAQAAFLSTTGNASTESLGLAGDMVFRPNPWTYNAKVAFAQIEDDEVLSARSFASMFRAARTFSTRAALFGQYDYLHDVFAGVEHRNTVQGGISYLAIDAAPHRLRLDGGIGFEHEDRLNVEASKNAVAIGGLAYRWQISETAELIEELRATLPFSNADQWKLDQGVSIVAAINTIFSLKLTNVVRFVNEPVPGFEQTDTITAVSLVMKMQRAAP